MRNSSSIGRLLVLVSAVFPLGVTVHAATQEPVRLSQGWAIQSSAQVKERGEVISTTAFKPTGWHPATVPTTVVAALIADKTYPDPHYGESLRTIPGTSYPIGANFSNHAMPGDSPFRVSWWYRREFAVPGEARGKTHWLRFDGINFRANIWMNGRRIADSKQIAGAWRIHRIDVTESVRPGETNVLAVEVFAPLPEDLAITFVDWNPMPPDKAMGIFREVTLSSSGPVALAHPQVLTRLNLPALDRAELTVKVEARNASRAPVNGVLKGRIEGIVFEKAVALAPGEAREVRVTPQDQPALVLQQPRLWWPWELGAPNLYPLDLVFVTGGEVSDHLATKFGIREFASEMTPQGHLVFKVNGRRILIRGAGYTPEMTLRSTPERQETEIRYVKDMHLNTIRLEGKLEDEQFFDIADREGVLIMPGWCCCDHWEKWKDWQAEDHVIAAESLRDQIRRLRNRASVLVWLNGSDNPPPGKVEKMYLDILKELEWPSPVVSNATEQPGEVSGPSGVKMRGPYEYVPPIYWQWDKKRGGAFGFATEIGPGPAVPPVESLKKMLPADRWWPINEAWNFHAGGGEFKDIKVFTDALENRYGKAISIEDYALKAQAAAYESHRAMFEAYGQNKYLSTGVIQWMLNNAWPSMIWHLYDFYLRPGGSYFGAKKACEPLHIQYSYDDRSVWVVNSFPRGFEKLKATVTAFDLRSTEMLVKTETVDIAADGTRKVLVLPELPNLGPTYFLKLVLEDASGKTVSSNFYWLSTKAEVLNDAQAKWWYTPITSYADLTGLRQLEKATVTASARFETAGDSGRVRVMLENPSSRIAFLVHLGVRQGPDGEEVLPIFWEDNYVSLAPGEKRELTAVYRTKDLDGQPPVLRLDGWNVAPFTVP